MSRRMNLLLALLAITFVIGSICERVTHVSAQNPPVDSGCCGKKPPKFPDLKATATTPAQTYSTFSGQIAVVTGQLVGASSLVIVDLKNQNSGVPVDSNWAAPLYRHPSWATTSVGNLFGVTLDEQGNIYATATTSYATNSPVTTANPGRIYRIDGTTGLSNVFATLPNQGPALGNIHYSCAYDSFYVSNFADGRIYQLKRSTPASPTGNVISTFDHQTNTIVTGTSAGSVEGNTTYSTFSVKNPPGVTKGGRVWGLAVFQNRLYYGVWRQDTGQHYLANNDNHANEVWSIALLPNGNPTGSPTKEVTLQALNLTNNILNVGPFPKDYSNPVASISFSPAGQMLLDERSMNGDENFPYAAHESRALEYSWSSGAWGLSAPNQFAIGSPHLTSTLYGSRPSSAGGGDYDPAGGRAWFTGDALHFPGYPLAPDPQTPKNTDNVYGIQGIPLGGGTVHNSLLIDLTGSTAQMNKNEMGDLEIPCPDCGPTATPSPSPAECCDKISAVPYPQNDLQLDYRTFTITNLKAPSSPICYVDISMSPTPNPIWQGGAVYVDGAAYSVGGSTAIHFGSPYTRLPNLPTISTNFSAVNTVKFNLGVDYTINWTGTVTFVVHHCDGSTCTLRYGPWAALPPSTVPGPQAFDINVAQEGRLATLGLQWKPRSLKSDVKWISFRVADEKSQIFAASAPPATAVRGRVTVEASLEDGGLNPNFVLYTFGQPLKSGQASSAFNLMVRSSSPVGNAPLVIFTTYDANGNAIETGTLNGAGPR